MRPNFMSFFMELIILGSGYSLFGKSFYSCMLYLYQKIFEHWCNM